MVDDLKRQNNNSTMKTLFLLTFVLITVFHCKAQTVISGKISDKSGQTLPGANIFIKATYDGTSSNPEGLFRFQTKRTGDQILVISMMGYDKQEHKIQLTGKEIKLEIKLKEAYNQLSAVVISAGSFEASEERKAITLKPLDILTTASAAGDIYGALRTLPGTQQVGEDGRLFVRGGESSETRTYIDGMLVQSPYDSKVPDIPSRGRFSPSLFSGTVFSTGGYSAEYGQAMSSALILKTDGLAPKTITGISLYSLGAGLNHTERWDNSSLAVSANYFNLQPYYSLVKHDFKWDKAPVSGDGQIIFRQKIGEKGLLKVFAASSTSDLQLQYPTDSIPESTMPIRIKNKNDYLNSTYSTPLGTNTTLMTGIAWSYNDDYKIIGSDRLDETDKSFQARFTIHHHFTNRLGLKTGVEITSEKFDQNYYNHLDTKNYITGYTENITAGFAEAEYVPVNKLAFRVGIRSEYSSILQKSNLMPRLSLAFKTSTNGQISLAYGTFYQSPTYTALRFTHELNFEQANHYIINYQYVKNDRTFRIEAYYKDYLHLIRYTVENTPDPLAYNNQGHGYAKGVDLFFRDQKTIKNLDYWLTYSFIDSKRLYKDFPQLATPSFISDHNINAVVKYFVPKLQSLFGLTYSYASGRPYLNPNSTDFMKDRTKSYNDVSMNLSYLTHFFGNFTIIYCSVSNVFGFNNVYGYHYSTIADASGQFAQREIKPDAKRFAMIAVFISLEKKKK
jgi:hypothetical protein